MHSGVEDDVLEGYEVPNNKWTSSRSSNPSMARIDERRRTTSGGSGAYSHSFLGKYGVGACLTPPHISQKGDTSAPMYWMRRMGMMENKIKRPDSKPEPASLQSCRRHVKCPSSQVGSKSSRSRRGLRAVYAGEVKKLEESVEQLQLKDPEGPRNPSPLASELLSTLAPQISQDTQVANPRS
mmetsp:Transcript_44822/g.70191  ORF Transcript_44822/g.70191 Transcript_44822/m.70191 type:complete len:182 (-) Transcript_44822:858-1403(-)